MPCDFHEVEKLEEQLNELNRFNAAKIGKEIEPAILKAKKILDEVDKEKNNKSVYLKLKKLFEKVGTWYLFHQHDMKTSIKFLGIYRSLFVENEKWGYEYAHSCLLLGRAYASNNFTKEKNLFGEAAAIIKTLLQNNTNLPEKNIRLDLAFVYRELGLYHHRKSFNEPTEAANARIYFREALAIFNEYAEEIDIAECNRLIGNSIQVYGLFTKQQSITAPPKKIITEEKQDISSKSFIS